MSSKPPAVPQLTEKIAELFPAQGEWSEGEYLALDTNRIVELSEGRLEIHDMPTDFHQLILGRLFLALSLFLKDHPLGRVRFSPLRVRLWPGKFREPDLVFMRNEHADRIGAQYWSIPDLVAEVLSESNPDLDRVGKKGEYARAGIPEYWLVDPENKTVEVFHLHRGKYQRIALFREGEILSSVQFPDFQIDLTELFAEE
jgi:Uma2 family endonuclease